MRSSLNWIIFFVVLFPFRRNSCQIPLFGFYFISIVYVRSQNYLIWNCIIWCYLVSMCAALDHIISIKLGVVDWYIRKQFLRNAYCSFDNVLIFDLSYFLTILMKNNAQLLSHKKPASAWQLSRCQFFGLSGGLILIWPHSKLMYFAHVKNQKPCLSRKKKFGNIFTSVRWKISVDSDDNDTTADNHIA